MIINNLIGNGVSGVFSAGSSEFAVTAIFFCNTSDVSDAVINVFLNTATKRGQVIKDLPLKIGETFVFDNEKLILGQTNSILVSVTTADTEASIAVNLSVIQTS